MAKTDALKKGIAKWDKKNMVTLGCRVTKQKKQEFQQACELLGTNMNAEFLRTVNSVISKAKGEPE